MDTITREVPFTLTRDAGGDGLTFSGYAAVFNSITRIDSWEGRFDEQIAPGAFAKTIRERTPVFQFDHGQHPMLGSIPIGAITELKEDNRGLYVQARLHDNWLTQPVRDAISSGSIHGMSFRFNVPTGKDTWDKTGDVPLRTVKELRCAELGPVVWPAYEDTTAGIRSLLHSVDGEARQKIAEAFLAEATEHDDERAAADADAEAVQAIVTQIEDLVAQLVVYEANELLAGDVGAKSALYSLLSMLSELSWFEYIECDEMCSTSTDQDSRRTWTMKPLPEPDTPAEAAPGTSEGEPSRNDAEPPPDSTPQSLPHEAARLRLLKLQRTA